MKNSYRLVYVFLSCFLACPVQEALAQDRPCSAGSDCLPNECCLSPVVPRGKREAPGYCKPAGDKGKLCYLRNELSQSLPSTLLYFDACPCKTGLACGDTGVVVIPQGPQGICVEPKVEKRVLSCSNSSDCAEDECCVSLVRPVGRRKRAIGECRKLGQDGGSCLVRITSVQGVNYECPCASGLTCHGLGVYDIPLGEVGVCKS